MFFLDRFQEPFPVLVDLFNSQGCNSEAQLTDDDLGGHRLDRLCCRGQASGRQHCS